MSPFSDSVHKSLHAQLRLAWVKYPSVLVSLCRFVDKHTHHPLLSANPHVLIKKKYEKYRHGDGLRFDRYMCSYFNLTFYNCDTMGGSRG